MTSSCAIRNVFPMAALGSRVFMAILAVVAVCFVPVLAEVASAEAPQQLDVLFLGDNGHHQPFQRYLQLRPVMIERGIKLDYTDKMSDVNANNLQRYDALLLYANIDEIAPAQAQALLDYVAGGGGFVPLHCASYCFRNSEQVVALMGGQFKRHGTGVFRTEIARPDHPIMRGFGGFESWDETYEHHLHNEKNRTVLAFRVDANGREPWTWVRTHGDGRVFYTAWGHDERTWGNPGFQNLVERGIRWAAGDDPGRVPDYVDPNAFEVPKMTPLATDVEPFEYVEVGAKIPNYAAGAKWGTQEKPMTQMQKPLPPRESIKHFSTPVGFEMQLFAAEPDLGGKPIAMNWDERGRLWVCETYDYPNELQPPGQGRDRIRICADTDGDGRADQFTVFAEGLSIPTAIAFYRGGAIVQDGTQTLFLKDTDGDDKADVRKVLISNWTLGDTHGGVSNFQYGLDNWIWAMQGYNFSEPIIQGVKQQGFRMGFFRFRLDDADPPNVTDLEFIRSTNNNTWGLGISEEGLIFGSTANHNPSVYMPIANRYYERVGGWSPQGLGTIADSHLFKPITDRVRQVDHHGGYTAGAGHALYTARAYPKQYWNRTAFVCGPTGHLVGTFLLKRDGTDFSSTSPCNLVASNDEWSAPIMAEVGPDGSVWVLDWYNFIVQHNPTPQGFKTGKGNAYETDLRDKKHGRVYRVVYRGTAPEAAGRAKNAGQAAAGDSGPDLANATPEELVAALRHSNFLIRRHAQRLLVERGQDDVVPALTELIRDESVDETGLNVAAIHALWTINGLPGGFKSRARDEALQLAWKHTSAGVRRNAALVTPFSVPAAERLVTAGLLQDPDVHVRLAALLAIAEMPPAATAVGEAIADFLSRVENTADRWLFEAAIAAAAANDEAFLKAILNQEKVADIAKCRQAVGIVSEHFARRNPGDGVKSLLPALATCDPAMAAVVISGWAKGWPKDQAVTLQQSDERVLIEVLNNLPPDFQGQLVRLATLWGNRALETYAEEIVDALLSTATSEKHSDDQRIAAAQQLIDFRRADDRVVRELLKSISARTSPDAAEALIGALARSESSVVGSEIASSFRRLTPAARKMALQVLLARPAATTDLLSAIEQGVIPLADLSLDQKQALAEHPDGKIREQAKAIMQRGGGLPSPDRQKVLEALLPLADKSGDAAAGKLVFKKQCSKCHVHSGEGTRIGPDLTGMAVHPKRELLVHLIDPSRSVEGNFRVYTVITDEGRVLTGLLAAESKTAIELIDAEAKKHIVLRDEIDELVASTKSLMPDGFEKQVSENEMVDLLEFLTQRGKFVPLDLRKVATIASDRGMFYSRDSEVERMIFPDWSTKTFNGVPFQVTDPEDGRVPNIILLHSPNGSISDKMPKSVSLPCNGPARAIHLLSGVSGWGFPASREKSVSMIVRLKYADGATEDHRLLNAVHFADYIRRVDVPESEFAFMLRNQQLRYLAIRPDRNQPIESIEFVKGPDRSAPIVMAVTVESDSSAGASQ